MDLFLLEHKKLWRRMSTKISVFLCFLYLVVFGSILSFQWFSLGTRGGYSTGFENNFDGYSAIRNRQEYARSFAGDMTDETLQRLVRDYQRMDADDMEKELEKTDWRIINNWIEILYPELKNNDIYKIMIDYVAPEKLTGFYGRRQKVLEEFLENNNQTGKEKEYLLRMNENVKTPFQYQWTQGWSILLGTTVAEMGIVMALFIAIALSTLFAGEWHNNTGSLILTTKNGWREIAFAKILTGLAFAAELSVLLAIGNIVSQIFFMGTVGWDMPIQTIKLIAVAPMNMLQAEIYEYAFVLLGAVGFAGIVLLISAAVKNNVLALILSLAVAYAPMMIEEYLPYGAQKALDLLPLSGSGADIFRTNTFHIFGKYVWSPYLLITVPVLIGVLCIPFAVKSWSR
ncbi:MAG: ABC transporter permease subunit, partial [Lachnospiraceae bacterium]|nr:ABC transporter permease subunit [Lachnospiraceae bacterium]